MLVWKRILWLRERVRAQKHWIDLHGGNLTGYIERYGDPGIPPLKNGQPMTILIDKADQHLVPDLKRVEGTEDEFYAPHIGDGGTAIYNADLCRLQTWERELSELQLSCYSARCKADEMEKNRVTADDE